MYLPGNVTLNEAAEGMKEFTKAVQAGTKVDYVPLIGFLDLVGYGTAGVLGPQTMVFFEAGVGQTGCGLVAPAVANYALTNFDGNSNMLPSGWAYWAHAVGMHLPQNLPLTLKDDLVRFTALRQRKSSSDIFEMGPIWSWPAGEFGHSSPSVSNTVANTQIQFGQNGRIGCRNLPRGGEMYFTALSKLHFEIQTYAGINLTTDGLAPSEENLLTEAIVFFILLGYKFQRFTN